MNRRRLTHGGSGTRLYTIWTGMIARCENPNHERFADYGGRGIAVCGEWRYSFERFREWAQQAGYTEDLTIERQNNDLGYKPSNCRWADNIEQSRNRRSSSSVVFEGRTMTIAELSETTGVSYDLLKQRIGKYGWSVDRAVTTPSRAPGKRSHTPVHQ